MGDDNWSENIMVAIIVMSMAGCCAFRNNSDNQYNIEMKKMEIKSSLVEEK